MAIVSRRQMMGGMALLGLAGSSRGFAQALAEGRLPPKSPAGIATTALSVRLREHPDAWASYRLEL